MKKLLLTACVILSFIAAFAQTSDKGFSFQGYAIDPDGKTMAGTGITVRFTLTATGGTTFQEEHTLTTDAFGVFHAIIGNSTVAKNTEFSKLDFTKKDDDYSLKVEVKKTSGGTYTTISNEPLAAVPYARKAENGVPVGSIVAFGGPKTAIPEGWMLCDGASVSRTTYSQLYAVIGDAWGTADATSFNLPDLRGRFLRGVDENLSGTASGNDPDRASRTASNAGGNTGNKVGTVQGGDIQSHSHSASTGSAGNHSHTFFGSNGPDIGNNADSGSSISAFDNVQMNDGATTNTTGAHTHTVTVNNSGGNETRPKNAAVYHIIKY